MFYSSHYSSDGKVVAIRRRRSRIRDFLHLDTLIVAAKVVRDASDIAPFPYAKFAASLVIQILEVIQIARQNQDAFEELGASLVEIIVMIRETLQIYHDGSSPPATFTLHCQEFVEKLLVLSNELNETVRQTRTWTRYFKAAGIRERIVLYRRQIDGLRSNFTLATVMQLSLQIYAKRLPHQLGYSWENSEPLHFIDAMDVTLHLPLELCSTQNDFDDLLKFIFRKRRGRRYVDRGDYILTTLPTRKPIEPSEWKSYVKPRATIAMDIVLHSIGVESNVSCQYCPSCGLITGSNTLEDDSTCSSCGTRFRVSPGPEAPTYEPMRFATRGTISDRYSDSKSVMTADQSKPPRSSPSTPSLDLNVEKEMLDTQYFRRYHVILNTWRLPSEVQTRSGEQVISTSMVPASVFLKDGVSLSAPERPGGGGFSDVFHGKYLGQEIALKRLRNPTFWNHESLKRFSREAVTLRELQHPNILPFLGLDSKTFPSEFCIVSPWMTGSLSQFRRNCDPRTMSKMDLLMLEIGLGLHYLHSMGIVHGYLHGANILLDENRHARLSDFGIVTEPDQLKHGCMRCMAPEIFVNQKDGPKIVKDTDVYAFASVYYKLYQGRGPHRDFRRDRCFRDNTRFLSPQHDSSSVPIPEDAVKFIEQCWHPHPKSRPDMPRVVEILKSMQPNLS